MKNYDDLIISLIKKHRKFPEYELILDDIAEEVKRKASAVLETVYDNSVVESYLEKIVATAMITVPKRTGFVQARSSAKVSELFSQLPSSSAVTEKQEEISEPSDEDDASVLENLDTIDEDAEIEDIIPEDDNVEESSISDVNIELVDKMINGAESKSFDISESESDEAALDEDYDEISVEAADDIEIMNTDESENLVEVNADSELMSVDSLDENEAGDNSEEIELDEDAALSEDAEAELENFDSAENETDEIIENSEDGAEADFVTEENDFVLSDDESSDFSEQDDLEINSPSFESLSEQGDSEFTPAKIEDFSDEGDSEFTPPSFECFAYNPDSSEMIDIGVREILDEYTEKYPEKKLSDICKLKYKEKKSVEEISEELEIPQEDVVQALKELVGLVKG